MRMTSTSMVLAVLLCGCAAGGGGTAEEPARQEGAAETTGPVTAADGTPLLRIHVTDQTTDGRVMLMRGKLSNPHPEPVQGVRLILVMVTPRGDDKYRITDVQRKELGSTIPPGKSVMFRWDVESQSNAGPGRFSLLAVPVRLGDRDIPPPAEWSADPPAVP